MLHKTTLRDRIKNAMRAFRGAPIASISYGVEVKRCSECERLHNCEASNLKYFDAIQMAYKDLVDFHHNGNEDVDFDLIIGYLGEALDD
jgi:hypothetical protein